MSLQGEIALVTGAGNGMGRAIALEFANEGASIVAADINANAVDAVAAEINDTGGRAIAVEADRAAHATHGDGLAEARGWAGLTADHFGGKSLWVCGGRDQAQSQQGVAKCVLGSN